MVQKAFSIGLYADRADSHAQNVLTDIKANPGSTQADIQASIPLNATNTAAMLDALIKGEQITERDDAGTTRYWSVGDWADVTWALAPQIVTHLGTVSDPSNFTQLATALAVTEAEVEGAVNVGQNLGDVFETEK